MTSDQQPMSMQSKVTPMLLPLIGGGIVIGHGGDATVDVSVHEDNVLAVGANVTEVFQFADGGVDYPRDDWIAVGSMDEADAAGATGLGTLGLKAASTTMVKALRKAARRRSYRHHRRRERRGSQRLRLSPSASHVIPEEAAEVDADAGPVPPSAWT